MKLKTALLGEALKTTFYNVHDPKGILSSIAIILSQKLFTLLAFDDNTCFEVLEKNKKRFREGLKLS